MKILIFDFQILKFDNEKRFPGKPTVITGLQKLKKKAVPEPSFDPHPFFIFELQNFEIGNRKSSTPTPTPSYDRLNILVMRIIKYNMKI